MKRFCAPDIRQAMRLVRDELGPDAVILSNRDLEEGVEIVAAMDFDPEFIQGSATESGQSPRTTEHPASSRVSEKPQSSASAPVVKPRPVTRKPASRSKIRNSASNSGGEAVPVTFPIHRDEAVQEKRTEKPRPKAKPATRPPAQPVVEPVLEEMRKEFQRMRAILSSQLAELSWTESVRLNPNCREVLRRLNACGFSESISKKIIQQMDDQAELSSAWDKVKRSVAGHLNCVDDNSLDYGGIISLVGPTGVGKTTTVAKIAAKFRLQYGARHVGLVTADNYRIAAHEQLYTYGRILDIPVRTAHDNDELKKVLNEFIDKRLVLIDTAGMSQRNVRLAQQFPLLCSDEFPVRTYLVMSAATQTATMNEIIQSFQVFKPYAGILTKLDETATLAAAVSSLIENQLPLSFVCDGQKVPENLRHAKSYGLAEHCFASNREDLDPLQAQDSASGIERIQAWG